MPAVAKFTPVTDETLEILRRLEPTLNGIVRQLGEVVTRLEKVETRLEKVETRLDGFDTRITNIENELAKLNERQRLQGERLAGVEGRISELPTLHSVVTTVTTINAGTVAIGFGLAKLLMH